MLAFSYKSPYPYDIISIGSYSYISFAYVKLSCENPCQVLCNERMRATYIKYVPVCFCINDKTILVNLFTVRCSAWVLCDLSNEKCNNNAKKIRYFPLVPFTAVSKSVSPSHTFVFYTFQRNKIYTYLKKKEETSLFSKHVFICLFLCARLSAHNINNIIFTAIRA